MTMYICSVERPVTKGLGKQVAVLQGFSRSLNVHQFGLWRSWIVETLVGIACEYTKVLEVD